MLISGANREQALHVLQKTRLLLRDTLAREGLRITCSIGCVAVHAAQIDVDDIIKAADQLMYRIKHGGKDGVFVEEFNS